MAARRKAKAKKPAAPKKKKSMMYRAHRAASLGSRPPVPTGLLALAPRTGVGAPTTYNPELGATILERLACGETLLAICANEGMPDARTVVRWCIRYPDFNALYDESRRIQAQVWADETIEIANNPEMGEKTTTYEGEEGGPRQQVTTGDMLEHRRLKITTRQYLMSRAHPKMFSEKVQTENHTIMDMNVNIKRIERVIIDPKPRVIEHDE